MSQLTIDIFSHHFVVTGFNYQEKSVIQLFLSHLVHVESYKDPRGMTVSKATKTFAASTHDRTEYRLHINSLDGFKTHLRHSRIEIDPSRIRIRPIPEAVKAEIPMNTAFVPRKADQEPIIDYFVNSPYPNLLAELQTGKGKTFSALTAVSRLGERFALVMRAQYIDNWMIALTGAKHVTMLSSDDILIIQGSAALKEVIQAGLRNELAEKCIIIGNRTLANFISKYEDEGCQIESYGCNPVSLWEILGVGTVVKDETHLDFHFNFKLDCYTHVRRTISLSATFRSGDHFIKRMQALQFPPHKRAPEIPYHRYADALAVRYHVPNPELYPHTLRGRTDYNHNKFESSILDRPQGLSEFKRLVKNIVIQDFLTIRKEGQRMLILCSSVDMCIALVDMLRHYDEELVVVKYTAEDNLDDVMSADIAVTTLISGSTAIDIPNLKTALLTTSVGSENTVLQTLGRLRELPGGESPLLVYLFTDDIRSPSRYHQDKLQLLPPRVLHYKTVDSGISLR